MNTHMINVVSQEVYVELVSVDCQVLHDINSVRFIGRPLCHEWASSHKVPAGASQSRTPSPPFLLGATFGDVKTLLRRLL